MSHLTPDEKFISTSNESRKAPLNICRTIDGLVKSQGDHPHIYLHLAKFALLDEDPLQNIETPAERTAYAIDEFLFPRRNLSEKNKRREVPRIGLIYGFWEDLLTIVREIPYDQNSAQDALVKVVAELKKIDRGEYKIWKVEERVWQDLPLLVHVTRECWSECNPCDSQGSGRQGDFRQDSNTHLAERYINSCAFYARLMRDGVFEQTRRMIALEFQGLLEYDYSEFQHRLARYTRLKVVNNFILMAGEKMYLSITKRALGEFRQGGPLWTGPQTVNQERWQFWLKRYHELLPLIQEDRGLDYVDTSLKEECQRALDHMEKITNGGAAVELEV